MSAEAFHIVVADDDLDDQGILHEALNAYSSTQIKVSFVSNGLELLTFLGLADDKEYARELPNAILLDLNMPIKDGLEVLRTLKATNSLRGIPVYVITTSRNTDKLEECLNEGASNFFTKPNQRVGYLNIIEQIMSELLVD